MTSPCDKNEGSYRGGEPLLLATRDVSYDYKYIINIIIERDGAFRRKKECKDNRRGMSAQKRRKRREEEHDLLSASASITHTTW